MRENKDISFSEFGQIVNKSKLTVSISYGSGGFSITIMDQNTEKSFGGYAWDINEAFSVALKRLNMYVVEDSSDKEEEVVTNPGGMRALPVKNANVYKLVTKEPKKRSKRK